MIEWLDCRAIADRINADTASKLDGKKATLKICGDINNADDRRYIDGLKKDGMALGITVSHDILGHADGLLAVGEYNSYLGVWGVDGVENRESAVSVATMLALWTFCGKGKPLNVAVMGRGSVGTSIAKQMLKLNHTVIVCHSRTSQQQLKKILSMADVCITAASGATFSTDIIDHNMTVIDTGYNFTPAPHEHERDTLIRLTPLVGGIGIITRAIVLNRVACNHVGVFVENVLNLV